jgi:hypothetical protein
MGGPSSTEKSVSGRSYQTARKEESVGWAGDIAETKERGKPFCFSHSFETGGVKRPQKPNQVYGGLGVRAQTQMAYARVLAVLPSFPLCPPD